MTPQHRHSTKASRHGEGSRAPEKNEESVVLSLDTVAEPRTDPLTAQTGCDHLTHQQMSAFHVQTRSGLRHLKSVQLWFRQPPIQLPMSWKLPGRAF